MSEAEKLIAAWAWTRQTKAEYEAEYPRYADELHELLLELRDYDLTQKLVAIENEMMALARKLKDAAQ